MKVTENLLILLLHSLLSYEARSIIHRMIEIEKEGVRASAICGQVVRSKRQEINLF